MKLHEVLDRLKVDEFWRQVEISYMSDDDIDIPAKLVSLLSEADKLIFEKLGIQKSDKVYFIAGSARLYLEPKLTRVFRLKGPIGDLDMVIPDEKIWERAIENGSLKEDEYSKDENGYLYRPEANKVIEVFSKWKPQLGGSEFTEPTREEGPILQDSVKKAGHYYMGIGDVIDYKLKLGRNKEQDIVRLIAEFMKADDTDENLQIFFRKLVDLVGEEEAQTLRKVMANPVPTATKKLMGQN